METATHWYIHFMNVWGEDMNGEELAYLCPLWQLPDYTNFPFRVQLCYYFWFFYWSLLQYIYISFLPLVAAWCSKFLFKSSTDCELLTQEGGRVGWRKGKGYQERCWRSSYGLDGAGKGSRAGMGRKRVGHGQTQGEGRAWQTGNLERLSETGVRRPRVLHYLAGN